MLSKQFAPFLKGRIEDRSHLPAPLFAVGQPPGNFQGTVHRCDLAESWTYFRFPRVRRSAHIPELTTELRVQGREK
jgi:hypothetical protein